MMHLADEVVAEGSTDVILNYGEAVKQATLDFADAIEQHGRRELYLRLWLEVAGETVSEQTVFFTAPRFLNLRRAEVQRTVRAVDDGGLQIELVSPVFQHRVELDIPGVAYRASDNYFDLYPNVPHRVVVRAPSLGEAELAALTIRSLVDSY